MSSGALDRFSPLTFGYPLRRGTKQRDTSVSQAYQCPFAVLSLPSGSDYVRWALSGLLAESGRGDSAAVLAIQRTEIRTSAEIGPFQVLRAEGVPRAGPKDALLWHIVHEDRNTQHRGQRDQFGTDMSVT